MQPFIPRLGGKSKMARKLVAMFPPHDKYIEPFIGGGSVFLRKTRVAGEVINDLDKEISQLWKGMQSSAVKLRKYDFTPKREIFDKLVKSKPRGIVSGMFRTIYRLKNSFGGRGEIFADKGARKTGYNLKRNLEKYKERLKGVTILNMDWKAVVRKYSKAGSFTFLDPPYQTETTKWIYKPITATELIPTLKKIKGKFLMTYESTKQIRKLFKGAGFRVSGVKTTYTIAPGQKKTKTTNLIVRNY